MTDTDIPRPRVASREEWLAARQSLLAREKEATHFRDAVVAERRRLPMVKIEKPYVFEAPTGKMSLLDLFAGSRQLIVYHFMFDPAWEKGCPGCTGFVDALGDLAMLAARDTSLAIVSRAPLAKLEAYRAAKAWSRLCVSSYGSDFNYDFHVTQDESVQPVSYNFEDKAELERRGLKWFVSGETHGLSVFFRIDDDVFHTYSTFARGCEALTDAYHLLDTTPYGRQEDWEDSPSGWPQKPTYG